MLFLALASAAHGSERLDWRLWSWSGAELVPSYDHQEQIRVEQQLGLALRDPSGLTVDALGAVRDPLASDLTGDVYRLALGLRGARYTASLGRFVQVGERGFLRLDGGQLDVSLAPSISLHGWGGRPWHPETLEPGDEGLVGGELRYDADGAFRGGAGWEGRLTDAGVVHRLHVFGRARNPEGSWASALAEVAPLESPDTGSNLPPARVAVHGHYTGENIDLGAGLRWEDLTLAVQPEALGSPMDWLTGPGYLALDLAGGNTWNALTVRGTLGPTLHMEDPARPGGMGRLGVELAVNDSLTAGLAVTGAAASPSWVAGGLAEAGWQPWDRATLRAQAGWFRFQSLEGTNSSVVEGRLSMESALLANDEDRLSLAADLATGSDRWLSAWVRAGISLRGTLGQGRTP